MSTIYLEHDASDLLGDVSTQWLRWAARDSFADRRWLSPGEVGCCIKPTVGRVLHCLSTIHEHTDPGFPKHTLLWVLRTGDARVTCRRRVNPPQDVGTIVAFDCHRRHALRYPPASRLRIWAAWSHDADEPWTVETARDFIRHAIAAERRVARERSDTGRRDRSNVTDPGNTSFPSLQKDPSNG